MITRKLQIIFYWLKKNNKLLVVKKSNKNNYRKRINFKLHTAGAFYRYINKIGYF
ncbi:hypothetical protein HMPREF0765_4637 [Sphingobacterium spiritivorum ATCC 33300]|uniref:Uncharacterized protein n=1 Tax=Sphingobacterium spiritivorum ATCC 33300 TaxID=525372 RepID=C2G4Y1_SPHSI|nr:hypothetical protein HMPREF0765_4637 [Sphingobacterium spiritivorum ATCC 33300]